MIVAPAYILSLKFEFLTFGQWEYVLQSLLFIVFCIIKRKVKLIYSQLKESDAAILGASALAWEL